MGAFEVVRTTSIGVDAVVVHAFINDFHHWPLWSPWEDIDPGMERIHTGAPSGVGACYAWSGNRKAGQGQQDYLVITLSDVVVSGYQVGGAESDAAGVDQTSLAFSRIVFEYRAQKPDGSLAAPVKAGWDLKTNKAV